MKVYFTFGAGHHDTSGRSLMGWYTIIEADSVSAAREKYFAKFGSKFSFCYTDPEFQDQIKRWNLQYEPFEYLDLCCQVPQDKYLKQIEELTK